LAVGRPELSDVVAYETGYIRRKSGLEMGRIRMAKAAIVLLADTETKESLGRMSNALTSVREFKEEGHEVTLIFDGAGTKWVGELSDPNHKYNRHFESVKGEVQGACAYCARAFGVKDEVQESGVELLGDFEGHPSLAKLVAQGYQVITF
jgi:hypothetical protein